MLVGATPVLVGVIRSQKAGWDTDRCLDVGIHPHLDGDGWTSSRHVDDADSVVRLMASQLYKVQPSTLLRPATLSLRSRAQASTECHTGFVSGNLSLSLTSGCTSPCAGDPGRACGGSLVLSTYVVIPVLAGECASCIVALSWSSSVCPAGDDKRGRRGGGTDSKIVACNLEPNTRPNTCWVTCPLCWPNTSITGHVLSRTRTSGVDGMCSVLIQLGRGSGHGGRGGSR